MLGGQGMVQWVWFDGRVGRIVPDGFKVWVVWVGGLLSRV